MEVRPQRNTQFNISALLLSFGGFFKKSGAASVRILSAPWRLLCKSSSFARFWYVLFPEKRKKWLAYIKRYWLRVTVPLLVCAVSLISLAAGMMKDTENSDYLSEGSESGGGAMVLQNYSTFDHSQPTHIAVRLSWDDGAINISGGKAEARIKATVYPVNLKDKKITWHSSDERIASIDSEGLITATAPGKVKITAKLASENKSAEAALTVRQPVSGIFLPTSTITLYEGGVSRLLSAKILPENSTNTNVLWKSKNSKVASVDSSGRVKPVGVGMTEIIAETEEGGFEGRCFVNVVKPSVGVQTLSVKNESDMTITVGESINTIITVSPSNAKNKTLKWSSSDSAIASVSQTGRIKGVGAGIAQITAESVNGKKISFYVEVTPSDTKDPFDLTEDYTAVMNTTGGIRYTSYDTSFPQAVRLQMSMSTPLTFWSSAGTSYASVTQVAEYMNPNSYYTDEYKFQFMDLSGLSNISEESLNRFLENKGVLSGMGGVFIEAARAYGVNEVYLAAHACLESGNGTSTLSTGVDVNGTTVYNVFGIGAYDSDAVGYGSQKAYKEGWTSVEDAIRGGARWISDYYINNTECRQNTLYKMLWNPENPGVHQYATDISWAVKQAVSIGRIFSDFSEAVISYDIPVYSGQIPPTLTDYE